MHSQARAFLQPTRANIHQYQFNNPILSVPTLQNIIMIVLIGDLTLMEDSLSNIGGI